MSIPKEALKEIATAIKVIEQTEETINRATKLFSCNSLFLEIGGGNVHCTIAPETKEEADILQQAIETVLNNRLIKAHSYLNTVIKEN